MPFQEYVSGKAPTVLPHAEYAIVEAKEGHVSVGMRRVELDRNALLAQSIAWSEPMGRYLTEQYRN
jgi:hypothetical protein